MSGMARAATARAAIRIDPADPGVGPSRRIELSVWQYLYRRSVTLETTDCNRRRTADDLAEEIVEGG